MKRTFIVFALFLMVLAPAFAADLQVSHLSAQNAKAWLDYTVPLPKLIDITAEARTFKGNVGLEIRANGNHPVYDEIRTQFAEVCGKAKSGKAFTVIVQVSDSDASLKSLDNANQAYKITASPDNKSLTISALAPQGAFYGWVTLKQLIKGHSAGNKLGIPIMTVTDWPDMERRGLWGTDNYAHLYWLADRKMNHMEQINARGMNPDGTYFARTKSGQDALETDSEKLGIYYVPVVLHLEQVLSDDMKKLHPEMMAVNPTHHGTMCYSQPKTVEMISEWIYLLAIESTSCEVDVWLTENTLGKIGCQCDSCKAEYHAVNEYRAVMKAWEMAKKKLGKYITLYLLTSETTEDYNRQMLSEIPEDVRIWYYHSLLTYNSIRAPMLRNYLGIAAKNGRWMGPCPNIDAWTHTNQPFTGADFIKYRMTEFVSKDMKGLLAYATPRVHYNKFNVEASAEWTWNLHGRDTREFAYSYAVRQGYKDPEKFAEWSETQGPIAWDIHGSSWPFGQTRDIPESLKVTLKTGTSPALGTVIWDCFPSPWGNVKSERQLMSDLAAMEKAKQLAEELNIPELTYETMVNDGYLRSMKAAYDLTKIKPQDGVYAQQDRAKAAEYFNIIFGGFDQAKDYLVKWEDCVRGPAEKDFNFTDRPINIINEVTDGLKETAKDMGVEVK